MVLARQSPTWRAFFISMRELPYFQFEPAEYLTKDISFLSYEAQGCFITICCYYWQRGCNLTLEQARKRADANLIDELIDEGIIKLNDSHISISFLDCQYDNAIEKSNIARQNGLKGGRPKTQKKPSALDLVKQKESESKPIKRKEKKREEIIYPFASQKFSIAWLAWKDYKKDEHRFTYKTKTSEQAALKKLADDSNNNEQTAILMIEASIANGWKGIFKLNEKTNERIKEFDKAIASTEYYKSI